MEFLNQKQKIIITIIATIIILFIGVYVIKKTEKSNYEELELIEETEIVEDYYTEQEEKIIDNKIIVHITGEIQKEGIIEIEKESRLIDVIEAAGGLTEEADLSKVNLAYEVKDGQKIYIPNIIDENEKEILTQEAGEDIIIEEKEINNKVNINTATQTELETLSGIGPSTALKIINFRNENGEFKTIEEIKNVPGIGESKFDNIKEEICVE